MGLQIILQNIRAKIENKICLKPVERKKKKKASKKNFSVEFLEYVKIYKSTQDSVVKVS